MVLDEGLRDPLRAARAIQRLDERTTALGLTTEVSTDMGEFARERLRVRDGVVSPMFDPDVNAFGANRAFWMRALDEDGKTVMLQAYRVDFIDTNLADWSLTWMLGLYHKRSEPVVPTYIRPPPGSQTEQVTGQVVYFGEAWVHPDRRRESLPDIYSRFGMILSLLKWHPSAIWGCMYDHLSRRGHSVRWGFPIIEPNVYRWEWEPVGASKNEWLMLARRSDLEVLIDEVLSREDWASS